MKPPIGSGLAFRDCDLIPEAVSLKDEIYFGLWFQEFLSMTTQPCGEADVTKEVCDGAKLLIS